MSKRFALLGLLVVTALCHAQQRVRDVIYWKSGGCAFTFDAFEPAHPNHKAVVWLVSGGWFSSHEGINPALAKPLTDGGFTVFEVVHGSQPKFRIPEIIVQLQHALRYLHENAKAFDIDPGAIGVSGMSSGGHLSLMLAGLQDATDSVAAVVAFMPPTDFLNWGATGVEPWKNKVLSIFMPAFGVNAETPEDTLRQIGHDLSPIYTVHAGFPPTLIVHGDMDQLVPLQQAKLMDSALSAAKIEHRLVVVSGGGHDMKTLLGGAPDMIKWFDDHLKVKGP